MIQYGLPALFALFVWWFSTGAIIYLDGLPQRSFRWSLLGANVMLFGALHGLLAGRADQSIAGAYGAFTCGLLVWAWQEMTFLMGAVTGPRRDAADPQAIGARRFRQAVSVVLYHELAIAAGAAMIAALTWGAANRIGLYTYLLLWGMRTSAKLNLFLGVRNLSVELLPPHLRYLGGYLCRRPMNRLFPFSVGLGSLLTVLLARHAAVPGASDLQATGFSFLATMMGLAVLEHWFMVVPLPVNSIWAWGLRSHAAAPPAVL
ncbi:putative photosynthetic complex assembly protein PuhE [Acidisphaera rubrifaciens]|nr:putative photosynthetic complex assembly protein PuhE [Acidisphaera rubrifaciens]